MSRAAEFRNHEYRARLDAVEYRREAKISRPERRVMLLTWAANRDADAAFYASQARYYETHQPLEFKEAAE